MKNAPLTPRLPFAQTQTVTLRQPAIPIRQKQPEQT
jgi:hypothetical protein